MSIFDPRYSQLRGVAQGSAGGRCTVGTQAVQPSLYLGIPVRVAYAGGKFWSKQDVRGATLIEERKFSGRFFLENTSEPYTTPRQDKVYSLSLI